MSGKKLRLNRILSPADGRAVIFPLDHGVTKGPIHGIENLACAVEAGIRGGADALVLHKGMLGCIESATVPVPGVLVHLSASTDLGPSPCRKVLTGSVESAVRLGADGVSVHINMGDNYEPEMLTDLGRVSSSCLEWQIPLLVMAYIQANRLNEPTSEKEVAHAARIAAELGADIIKIPFPGDYDTVARITSSLAVPVVVAGGVPGDIGHILERIEKCMEAGARGVATGRNVFQHQNPEAVLRAIGDIVHRGVPAEDAAEPLKTDSIICRKRT
jgi:class I fructose-bisphosphate aldolase